MNSINEFNESIVNDVTAAWNQLDSDLIIKHLDESFVYDSQWVFESLDFKGYIDYIRSKFAALRRGNSSIKAETVADPYFGGVMTKITQQDTETQQSNIAFFRIRIDTDKIIKGDLCMF